MLAKILYGVVVVVLLGYGIYFVYMSKQDLYSKDVNDFNRVAEEWNDTKVNELRDWSISLKNWRNDTISLKGETTKRHQYEEGHQLFYDAFQFVENNLVSLIQNMNLNKTKADSIVKLLYLF